MVRIVNGVIVQDSDNGISNPSTVPVVPVVTPQQPYQYQHFEQPHQSQQQNDQPTLATSFMESFKKGSFILFGYNVNN